MSLKKVEKFRHEFESCKIDKFIYFKFGACKVLHRGQVENFASSKLEVNKFIKFASFKFST
jgi:hypothetical protein